MLMGYAASRVFGFDSVYHRTMMFEVGTQNLTVAIQVVTLSYYGPIRTTMLCWTLVYQLMSFVPMLPIGALMRFKYPTYMKEINEKNEQDLIAGVGAAVQNVDATLVSVESVGKNGGAAVLAGDLA